MSFFTNSVGFQSWKRHFSHISKIIYRGKKISIYTDKDHKYIYLVSLPDRIDIFSRIKITTKPYNYLETVNKYL